jgi:MFS superfamily sulfate permease-like transporter
MRRWIRWLPGIETLRRYETARLPHDIFAGLVLATMLVPVGIAYAASGLPGIYGLYVTASAGSGSLRTRPPYLNRC